MKHFFISLLFMLAWGPAFSNSFQKSQPEDQKPLQSAAQTRIAVVSDIHVMAPSLLPEEAKSQDAWKTYYAGDRKMLEKSVELFDQFLTNISSRADVLLITGDLTKDGELASHKYVVEKLKASGLKKIYVIPGNHDFGGSGNATKFNADGTTEAATVVNGKQFKNGYAAFGYGEGSTLDPNGSLSYVAEPVEGLVLLGIDSHTSSIPSETLTWLCDQAKDARANGKQVIAMMHHPLIEHIKGASMYISTYTVGSNTAVRDALIEAGVKVILTGHFHTSDIAYDWNDDEANGIYDINTGSLISYPCDYRLLTLSEDMQTLHVATESLNPAGSEEWLHGRLEALAKSKMNAKAGSYAPFIATYVNELADFAADLFILHAKGDEDTEANATEREGLRTRYRGYKGNLVYSTALGYGGIEDASIYSVLDNKSHYGEDHECQTADRTLDITLPSLGETVTLSADGWASYCTGHDLDISLTSNVKAYVVTGTTDTAATLAELTRIPAGEGFLLQGTPGTSYTLKATSGVGPVKNLLIGTLEVTSAPAGSFVLANKSDGFGFYPAVTGLQIPARKAYLPSTVSAASMLLIGTETTGIGAVGTERQNQQPLYTLQGTRASGLHPGLYIQNGKKIIVK